MKKLIAPVAAIAVIGAAGLSLIQTSEGKVNRTYLDPVGIPTACYGHTGPDVKMGQRYTDAQCDILLVQDANKAWAAVDKCIVPTLNQNQKDAIVSFTFNVGAKATCSSTLVRKINAGDYPGAGREFGKWVYGTKNGERVKLPGLETRRQRERALFMTAPTRTSVPGSPEALRAAIGHYNHKEKQ